MGAICCAKKTAALICIIVLNKINQIKNWTGDGRSKFFFFDKKSEKHNGKHIYRLQNGFSTHLTQANSSRHRIANFLIVRLIFNNFLGFESLQTHLKTRKLSPISNNHAHVIGHRIGNFKTMKLLFAQDNCKFLHHLRLCK